MVICDEDDDYYAGDDDADEAHEGKDRKRKHVAFLQLGRRRMILILSPCRNCGGAVHGGPGGCRLQDEEAPPPPPPLLFQISLNIDVFPTLII